MIKCNDIENRLLAIVEGSLDRSEAAAIAAHLRECPSCGAMVAHYQAIFAAEMETPATVPETLWRSIRNRINELEEGRQPQPTLFPKRRPLLGYALQTLAIATAIVVGVILGKMPETETSFEDEIVSYYAGALTQTALPIEEVLEQVSQGQGGDR